MLFLDYVDKFFKLRYYAVIVGFIILGITILYLIVSWIVDACKRNK